MYKYGRYTLLNRHEINANLWDLCLKRCAYSLPYAHRWWLDIVSPGWQALVEMSEEGYISVFPLPVVKKFGYHLLRQPVFGHQLGLFQAGRAEPERRDLGRVIKIVSRHFRYIDGLALYGSAGADIPCPSAEQVNYLVDLQQPYEKIVSRYAGNRRREIMQAKASGIVVSECESPEEMIRVFQEYIEPGIYGIDGSEYNKFRALFRKWRELSCVTVYESRLDGEWLAGAAILHWGHRHIYIFNSSTPRGKELDALSFLIDRVLHAQSGSHVPSWFDFEAPASDSVLDYYRRFGGTEERYEKIYQNHLPFPIRLLQNVRRAWVQRSRK